MLFFQAREFVEFNLGFAEGDAAMSAFFGLDKHSGGVKEGFGRDATAIEADAAEFFVLLDEENFFSEVGGVKGGRIAARAGTENYDFCDNWVHSRVFLKFWLISLRHLKNGAGRLATILNGENVFDSRTCKSQP